MAGGFNRRGVGRQYLFRRLLALLLVFGAFLAVSAGVASGVTFVSSMASGWFGAAQPSADYDTDSANSLTVVVNKARPMRPLDFYPGDISDFNLSKPAAAAFSRLKAAILEANASHLVVTSGFRDFASQQETFDHYTSTLGEAAGGHRAARPGFSEHQTGLAVDVAAQGQNCAIKVCFAKTVAGRWLAKNSWRFGFILRYPNGATSVTGYQFEPWHFRFVGAKLASAMHAAKAAVLETFLGLPPAPDYLDGASGSQSK